MKLKLLKLINKILKAINNYLAGLILAAMYNDRLINSIADIVVERIDDRLFRAVAEEVDNHIGDINLQISNNHEELVGQYRESLDSLGALIEKTIAGHVLNQIELEKIAENDDIIIIVPDNTDDSDMEFLSGFFKSRIDKNKALIIAGNNTKIIKIE